MMVICTMLAFKAFGNTSCGVCTTYNMVRLSCRRTWACGSTLATTDGDSCFKPRQVHQQQMDRER
jgi:hypothetical protein